MVYKYGLHTFIRSNISPPVVLTENIYQFLHQEFGLKAITIPVDSKGDETTVVFFMTQEAFQKETVLILMNETTPKQTDQWTTSHVTDSVLRNGSQLPYIEFGQREGYGVIVLNNNLNIIRHSPQTKQTSDFESLDIQAIYVWDRFIEKSAAKRIAVVAHGYGAAATSRLSDKRKEFRRRVFAIAFTDPEYGSYRQSKQTKRLLTEVSPFYKISRGNSTSTTSQNKASQRPYFIILLKRAGIETHHLVKVSTKIIRSIIEYACRVWHTSLTTRQTNQLENIQKGAMRIRFCGMRYNDATATARIPTGF
ncbi:hypothetical protein LSH36_148g06028 [Paralvinella palmiformis]|uniref:Arb2 domain-containing protein n=1 Tax=Paralvinella palmiformis TaxID=53620 RepID=A0AAD9JV28_9ANNE|nr:hypothetical protein LSH36_148g06028 [Paralvinella palmiformis]